MYISHKFRFAEHPEYGSMGLAMVGRDWADPAAGMAIAHDILEHAPNDRGDTEGEMMALGASIFVRSGDEYYQSKGRYISSAAENIASDFPQQWHYMLQAGRETLRDPGVTHKLDDEYAEQTIQDTVENAVKLCRGEFEPDEFPVFLTDSERSKVIGWMRKGYRAAKRRFRSVSQGQLTYVFGLIEKAADNLIRDCESECVPDWARCAISVNVKTGRVSAEICDY